MSYDDVGPKKTMHLKSLMILYHVRRGYPISLRRIEKCREVTLMAEVSGRRCIGNAPDIVGQPVPMPSVLGVMSDGITDVYFG